MGKPKWVTNGNCVGPFWIWPSGSCPANFCRIDFLFNSAHFCVTEYLNSFHDLIESVSEGFPTYLLFHKAVEDVRYAEMHE